MSQKGSQDVPQHLDRYMRAKLLNLSNMNLHAHRNSMAALQTYKCRPNVMGVTSEIGSWCLQ